MSDEIKEILEYYRKYMSIKDCIKLSKIEDYMTNLQQKVEQYENPDDLTLFYMWLDEKAKDKMKHLQQENERLRQQNFNLIEYRDSLIDENREQREDLFDYKSRTEKAIELLKQDKQSASFNSAEALAINILQGGKDE